VTSTGVGGSVAQVQGPTAYSFLNASAVFNGKREDIGGSFVYDPLTDIQYGGQIVLTGPAPYAGLYGFDIEQNGLGAVFGFGPGALLDINLANPLSLSEPDPIRVVDLQNLALFDFAPTGFVVPPGASVPEASSLALVGAALGLLLLGLPIGGVQLLSRLFGRAA
jgi:hypothetical protein